MAVAGIPMLFKKQLLSWLPFKTCQKNGLINYTAYLQVYSPVVCFIFARCDR